MLPRLRPKSNLPFGNLRAFSTMLHINDPAPEVPQARQKSLVEMRKFWSDNLSRGRPLSDNLSVYKFPKNSIYSITHRLSGVFAYFCNSNG